MNLPDGVTLEPGLGGLSKVLVSTPLATAEVYLHGAHVTRYQPAGQPPVLFLSGKSKFEPGKAIRGGVPICFPWFGPLEGHPKAPAHGFARTSPWVLSTAMRSADGTVTLTLSMSRAEDAASDWPHAFAAEYAVTIGPSLTTALTVHHVRGEPFLYEAALHTYLVVGDVRQATVHGLENTPWRDKVLGRELAGIDGPIRFVGETDRVYLDTTAPVTVDDPALNRRLVVAKGGSMSTVVWNPWVAKAAAMADFGDDEWPGMLCVETANIGAAAVTLGPGQSHTTTATVTASRR
jgi:glucose-6-phosphate 1-epimerase